MSSENFELSALPTRYISSIIVRGVSEVILLGVQKLHLSVDEVAIVTLVAAESTRPIVEDAYLTQVFGYEEITLPAAERPIIRLKFIASSLGLNRETCRRRLNRLVERGFILKRGGGYITPEQIGGADYSDEMRRELTAKFLELRKYFSGAQIGRQL